MVGIIFSAGLGTRLKPLTDTMPKALVPLAGKPLLQWQVERLREAGITDIIVNVHHFPDMIIDAIRQADGWGCNILVSDERDLLLDTGGGLRKAKSTISNLQSSTFNLQSSIFAPILACNVDILSNIDLRALIRRYEQTGISQLVVSERQTQRYLCFNEEGLLRGWTNIATGELKGQDGRHLAFSGMQILTPEVLARLDEMPEEKFSLIDFYLHLCEHKHSTLNAQRSTLMAFVPENYRMMDVGKIDQIAEAEAFAESL